MVIKINGKEENVGPVGNLARLISEKGLVPEHIVVEHNFRIVPNNEWTNVILKESDNIEIVSFVGGG